ncbi:FAD/NAD(P)-binding domain-containing protein [Viridothelium virens]|uniref:FAD/NAD(P)-binding domain-containing protein n=1 Tax=Viridothelium virens TaxID=1048519 RepID=A0A6A6HJW7_VIRVR|nr:FAD/NAD(P)-binding domain-containing protein [Viridothelium virens]
MPTFDPPPRPTGIRVLIVGAGFAGLTAAIECLRYGHKPIVLESFPQLKVLGDIISFSSNSGRIFQSWPGIEERLDPICHNSDGIVFKTYDGEYLLKQYWEPEQAYGKKFNGHRGEIHEIVYEYARELGIEIRLDQQVMEYWETDTEAGVVLNGERMAADVVLAADGVRSKARTIVLGYEDKPKSSGYAVYRAWMDSDELAKNPLTADLVVNGDSHTGWLGPDIHFLAASIKNGREFSWVCTHKDEADVEESWQAPGSVSDALRVLEGWDPTTHAIVRATPAAKLVDWKLVYRDPLPTWLSPQKRIALIGDAAHPFLPTSIQGASQSMEDGTCIAVCLALSGKDDVPTALRAFERMRYERVKKAQETGVSTRDTWHKADFDRVRQNPESIKLKREAWLLDHDAEKHAHDQFETTVAQIRDEDNGISKL